MNPIIQKLLLYSLSVSSALIFEARVFEKQMHFKCRAIDKTVLYIRLLIKLNQTHVLHKHFHKDLF